jgi:hypothetical protein
LASMPPFCICLCSKSFSLQSPCDHLEFKKGQERSITSSWQGMETTPNSRPSSDGPPRWLLITTPEPLPEQGLTEIIVNQTTPVTGTV